MLGTLWVVATPLGNMEDITLRARRILGEVPLVVAEDTRIAKRLFSLLGLSIPMVWSFCDYTEAKKIGQVLQQIEEGKDVALISDAGMPAISDPGYLLVRECHKRAIPVRVVAGASSVVTALAGSGIAPIPFTFLGFLPRGEGERRQVFELYTSVRTTLIFFERKNRVIDSLKIAYSSLGEREVCIARELTKVHEEYIVLPLSKSIEYEGELQGEVTVIIGKAQHIGKTEVAEVISIYNSIEDTGSLRNNISVLQKEVQGYTKKELYAIIEGAKRG